MSDQMLKAYADQWNTTMGIQVQQTASLLSPFVNIDSVTKGDNAYYRSYDRTELAEVTARNAPTPYTETPQWLRQNKLREFSKFELVDAKDNIASVIDVNSGLSQAFLAAANRAKDRQILAAVSGTSYGISATQDISGGRDQAIAFDSGQAIAAGATGLTFQKILDAADLIGKSVVPPNWKKVFVVTQKQLTQMLASADIASNDYNIEKPRVDGNITYYLGFNFIKVDAQLLPVVNGVRTCFAFYGDSITLRMPGGDRFAINEVTERSLNYQMAAKVYMGTNRTDEKLVASIDCKE